MGALPTKPTPTGRRNGDGIPGIIATPLVTIVRGATGDALVEPPGGDPARDHVERTMAHGRSRRDRQPGSASRPRVPSTPVRQVASVSPPMGSLEWSAPVGHVIAVRRWPVVSWPGAVTPFDPGTPPMPDDAPVVRTEAAAVAPVDPPPPASDEVDDPPPPPMFAVLDDDS
jgi:hypothetical protein